MVSLEQVARRVLSYVPYVLVLVDLRYEGKKKSNTLRANFCWGARRKPSDTHRPHTHHNTGNNATASNCCPGSSNLRFSK